MIGLKKVKLKDICDVKTGPFGSLLHERDYVNKGTPIITVEHLSGQGIIHDNLPFVSDEDKERLKSFILKEGDIVFSRVGSVDRSSVVTSKEEGWLFSGRLLRVRPDPKKVSFQYLNQYFQMSKFKNLITKMAVGGTMPSLNTSIIENIDIYVPQLNLQKKVASVLQIWDTAIEKTEKLIEAKERRFSWMLNRLINQESVRGKWRRVKLGEIVEINKGQQLNVADMVDTGKYYALNGGIDPSGFTNNWNTHGNTITISEGGNSCGFVNFNTEKFWCGGHCYALSKLSGEVLNRYLYHFLKAHEPLLMALRVGSGLPNIQRKDLLNFTVAFPPLSEQNIIADVLNTARQEIDILKKQADAYRKQKRGLMQKLLTGEWRVKVGT